MQKNAQKKMQLHMKGLNSRWAPLAKFYSSVEHTTPEEAWQRGNVARIICTSKIRMAFQRFLVQPSMSIVADISSALQYVVQKVDKKMEVSSALIPEDIDAILKTVRLIDELVNQPKFCFNVTEDLVTSADLLIRYLPTLASCKQICTYNTAAERKELFRRHRKLAGTFKNNIQVALISTIISPELLMENSERGDDVCPICMTANMRHTTDHIILAPCAHRLCPPCSEALRAFCKSCPVCREDIIINVKKSVLQQMRQ